MFDLTVLHVSTSTLTITELQLRSKGNLRMEVPWMCQILCLNGKQTCFIKHHQKKMRRKEKTKLRYLQQLAESLTFLVICTLGRFLEKKRAYGYHLIQHSLYNGFVNKLLFFCFFPLTIRGKKKIIVMITGRSPLDSASTGKHSWSSLHAAHKEIAGH